MNAVPEVAELPRWEPSGSAGRAIQLAGLAGAPLLIIAHAARLGAAGEFPAVAAIFAALLALIGADLLSGIVHWSADTWGSEKWPLIGPRLLRPFRLHHVNPDDLLRRDFIECNGDVAVLSATALALMLLVPVDSAAGRLAAVFVAALAAWMLPTNQVHQWAHQAEPPRIVQRAQGWGLILDRPRHAVHHVDPFDTQYCILTGWCNRPLAAIRFFPTLERAVTAVTGLVPRGDEQTPGRQMVAGTGARR